MFGTSITKRECLSKSKSTMTPCSQEIIFSGTYDQHIMRNIFTWDDVWKIFHFPSFSTYFNLEIFFSIFSFVARAWLDKKIVIKNLLLLGLLPLFLKADVGPAIHSSLGRVTPRFNSWNDFKASGGNLPPSSWCLLLEFSQWACFVMTEGIIWWIVRQKGRPRHCRTNW